MAFVKLLQIHFLKFEKSAAPATRSYDKIFAQNTAHKFGITAFHIRLHIIH
jgi:hypothetical protein